MKKLVGLLSSALLVASFLIAPASANTSYEMKNATCAHNDVQDPIVRESTNRKR